MRVRVLLVLVAAVVSASPLSAVAAIHARLLASGFNRPIAVVFDPVVPGAIHLVQQDGLVRTFLNGVERPTPFLDLRGIVSGGTDERGLLGLVFPPNAAATGRVFVNFTNRTGAGNTVVARFTRSTADPLVVNPQSRFDLQWPAPGGGRQGFITQPFTNHNGGHLAFGPDGHLYIGLGDGGAGDDPDNNAQTGSTLLGKMLRIDVSVPSTDPVGYAVPPTNPVFPVAALPEIWSFGLRNPWRYSFDNFGPGATGALVMGDVGQGAREEIDYEPAGQGGRNYGWRVFEGTIANPSNPPGGPAYFPVQAPIFDYPRTAGRSITGGFVYRGAALGAAYAGRYFYADCVSGRIWSLQLNVGAGGEATASNNTDHTTELGGPFNCISSFARDAAGELYFMDFGFAGANTGRVFKIEVSGPQLPSTPTGLAASVSGNTVTISWAASTGGGTPTAYVMEAGRSPGSSDVGGASTPGTGLFFAGVPNGRYYVRVRATNPAGSSAPTADIVVDVGCAGPPSAPTTYTTSLSGRLFTATWNVSPGATATIFEAGLQPGTTFYNPVFAAPSTGFSVPAPPGIYYTRVRAVNACGVSGPSVERLVQVP